VLAFNAKGNDGTRTSTLEETDRLGLPALGKEDKTAQDRGAVRRWCNAGEDSRYPIEPVSGLDALRHLVECSGKTRATVAAEAGLPESTLSEVLSGRRRLNARHIGILARYFRIDPGVFLDAPTG